MDEIDNLIFVNLISPIFLCEKITQMSFHILIIYMNFKRKYYFYTKNMRTFLFETG